LELEDAEAAKANALKEKTTLENELNELRCQLEILTSAKKLVDDKNMVLLKERNNLKLLFDEQNDQFKELVKKYKAHIQQSQMDSITLTANSDTIAQLEATVRKLNDELATVTEDYQKRCNNTVDIREHNRLLLKLRDIEAKLNVEQAQRQNADSRIESYRDELESAQDQLGEAQQYRDKEIEATRKAVKERLEAESQIKDLRRKLDIFVTDLDKARAKYDQNEQELRKAQNDLKISQKRIEELQAALYSEISLEGDSESDDEAMGGDSIGDEDDSELPIGDLRPLRNSTPKDQYNGVFA
uniref:Myosin heavy chain n=2 Tax=Panagrolaimus sp. PS1159 TaxID=55785 RepID=A0AC35EWK6_9BILA